VPGAKWRANLGSLPFGIRSSLSAWLTRGPSYPVSKTSKIEHQVGGVFLSRLKSPMTSWRSNSQGRHEEQRVTWPRVDKRSHRSLEVNPRTLTGLDVTLAEGMEGVSNLGANPSTPFPCPSFPKIFFEKPTQSLLRHEQGHFPSSSLQ
jgi:hypothetical protein